MKHGDISTVSINGNPIWPRVLIEGSEDRDGDGKADGRMTCSDPNDCTQVRPGGPPLHTNAPVAN